MKDLIIRDGRIIDPKNNFWQTADILIENGKIVEIGDGLSARGSAELNARGKLVVPGIIDMHTHMRTLFLSFIEESQIISRGPLSPKGSLVF